MNEKEITTLQSIELISKMIENTRSNFNKKGGMMFIIWGYTAALVAAGVLLLYKTTGNPGVMWAWWALPVIGWVLTYIHLRKNPQPVTTYMDKLVNYIWMVFTIGCMASVTAYCAGGLILGRGYFDLLLVVLLLMSSATLLTGIIIKFRPIIIGGAVGIAGSLVHPLLGWDGQMILFIGLFLTVMAIPGHILNYKEKRS